MTDEHTHSFGPVSAGYTAPGDSVIRWKACRICGEEDPKNPRPEEALDHPPEDEE